jgi:tellurite resistance protein TehA-like permease
VSETRPLGDLDAGAFAVVMATGIMSIAASLQSRPFVSDALLALACVGWFVLAGAVSRHAQLVPRRPRLQSFALVAATAVLGARVMLAGADAVALVLWGLAFAVWLVLVWGRPAGSDGTGSSLLIVVATESLGVLAALLARRWHGVFLVAACVAWLIGLGLYPWVAGSISKTVRRSRRYAPDLWILMGALAIATLAGTELLVDVRTLQMLDGLKRWLPDVDLATWSLASLLIVPLVVAETRTRSGWRYDARRWGFVFPLGMYAVASHTLGKAEQLSVLSEIGSVFFVIALAAWALATLGLVRRGLAAALRTPG